MRYQYSCKILCSSSAFMNLSFSFSTLFSSKICASNCLFCLRNSFFCPTCIFNLLTPSWSTSLKTGPLSCKWSRRQLQTSLILPFSQSESITSVYAASYTSQISLGSRILTNSRYPSSTTLHDLFLLHFLAPPSEPMILLFLWQSLPSAILIVQVLVKIRWHAKDDFGNDQVWYGWCDTLTQEKNKKSYVASIKGNVSRQQELRY